MHRLHGQLGLLKNLDLVFLREIYVVYFFGSHKYATDAESLHEHVLRHNHGAEDNGLSINCIRISFDHEYPLVSTQI